MARTSADQFDWIDSQTRQFSLRKWIGFAFVLHFVFLVFLLTSLSFLAAIHARPLGS